MAALKLIGIGLIVILALPGIVAASEGRRTHSIFHALLALGGLVWNWSAGGVHGLALSLASGAIILASLVLILALTQSRWNRRPLTGGEVKLIAASATWLLPLFAIIFICLAIASILLWLFVKQSSQMQQSRPDITPFVIVSLLTVFIAA
jgi:hypothetical protein